MHLYYNHTLYSFPLYTFLWPEDGPQWPKHVVSIINRTQDSCVLTYPTPSLRELFCFVMPENVSHLKRAISFLTTRLHPHVPSSWYMCSADILLQPFYCETKYMFPFRSRLPYLCPRRLIHLLHACVRSICTSECFWCKYYSCNILSFGWFPGVWILCADASEHCSIFIGGVGAYTTYEDGTHRVFRNVGI